MSDKELILKYLARYDGQWSWYELDRALSTDQHLTARDNMMPLLKELATEGLIVAGGSNPTMPRYCLTEAGQQRVQRHG